MRLLIDMQGAQNDSRFRGIGRYVKALVSNMLEFNPSKHQVYLLLNGELRDGAVAVREWVRDYVEDSRVVEWFPAVPASFHMSHNTCRRAVSEEIRNSVIEALAPDIVLISSLFEGWGDDVVTSVRGPGKHVATVVIFYDLIPMLYPDRYLTEDRARRWYEEKVGHSKRADLLLAISESTRRDGVGLLGISEQKVKNISSGVDEAFKPGNDGLWPGLSKRLRIKKPYLFYSGAADPRKNLPGLLRAFAEVPPDVSSNFLLVFAGQVTKSQREDLLVLAKQLPLGVKHLILTGHVSDDELRALYCHAHGFVFPSIYEGFGLPPLEAMACGIPVIASNASSVPEVVGVEEALFDPMSTPDMSRALEHLMTDEAFRRTLLERQSLRISEFSWKDVASRTWAALETLYAEASGKRHSPPAAPNIMRVGQEMVEAAGTILARCGATARDFIRTASAIDRSLRSIAGHVERDTGADKPTV